MRALLINDSLIQIAYYSHYRFITIIHSLKHFHAFSFTSIHFGFVLWISVPYILSFCVNYQPPAFFFHSFFSSSILPSTTLYRRHSFCRRSLIQKNSFFCYFCKICHLVLLLYMRGLLFYFFKKILWMHIIKCAALRIIPLTYWRISALIWLYSGAFIIRNVIEI